MDIVHQIWIQGRDHLKSTQPPQIVEWCDKWKRLSHVSGYDYIFWDESMYIPLVAKRGLVDKYHSRKNLTQRSDIARQAILLEYGGIYVDVDVEPVCNVIPKFDCDILLQRIPLGIFSHLTLQNAVIGIRRGHQFATDMLKNMKIRMVDGHVGDDWHYISSTTGSKLMSELIRPEYNIQYLDEPDISFDYGGYYLSTRPSDTKLYIVHQLVGKQECNYACMAAKTYSVMPRWYIVVIIILLLIVLL
jgi:mannosyltransferase OCH1-like enzyme